MVKSIVQLAVVLLVGSLFVVAFLGWRVDRRTVCAEKIKTCSWSLQLCVRRGLDHDCNLAVEEMLEAARLNCGGFVP